MCILDRTQQVEVSQQVTRHTSHVTRTNCCRRGQRQAGADDGEQLFGDSSITAAAAAASAAAASAAAAAAAAAAASRGCAVLLLSLTSACTTILNKESLAVEDSTRVHSHCSSCVLRANTLEGKTRFDEDEEDCGGDW